MPNKKRQDVDQTKKQELSEDDVRVLAEFFELLHEIERDVDRREKEAGLENKNKLTE